MGKVHRNGTGHKVRKLDKRHKRRCASAPSVPANVTVEFVKRHVKHEVDWYARVKWDAVTDDVAGRPLTPEAYDVQLRATDASGNPVEVDGLNHDFWRELVAADADTRYAFHPLPRPKTLYFQARVRVLNRIHGGRCWSAWSSWTTAEQPVSGALEGPPAPTGVELTFDRVEGAKGNPWRARARCNTAAEWDVTDGDPVEVEGYNVQLGVAKDDTGTDVLNVRRGITVPHDPDETYARYEFGNIRGRRGYRVRFRAFALGRVGAWSSWTTWDSPNGAPAAPTDVECEERTPRDVLVTWEPPTDLTDVDGYLVQIIRQGGGGTLVEEATVGGALTKRYRWAVPKAEHEANPGANYRARVFSVEQSYSDAVDDDPLTEGSADTQETSVTYAESVDIAITETWEGTVVPVATDGDAPASSPTPELHGGVGYIAAQWDGVSNADPVTYEVHVSTSTGFTPDSSTLYAEQKGTLAFIKTLPDGTALEYFDTDGETPLPYYVRIIAKDDDGSAAAGTEASASMTQATGPDIAVGTVTADHVFAASFATQYLGAVDSLISNLVAGDPEGQHIEIDADGLRVISADGDTLVNLPTDENQRPTFNGDLIAQNLEVIGATILGATTIAKGTDVTLESTVTAPSTAPGVAIDYPSTPPFKEGGIAQSKPWFALAYTASGDATEDTPVFYTARPGGGGTYWRYIEEHEVSTGALLRTLELPEPNDDCWGLAVIGSNLYVLHQRWSTGAYYVREYAIATLTQTDTTLDLSSVITSDKPGFGTDGTSLFIVCGASQASPANLRVITMTTALAVTNNNTHTALTFDTRETGGNKTTEWSSFIKVGSVWYLGVYSYDGANIDRRGVYAFTGNPSANNGLTRSADDDFNGELGEEVDGLAHDGTVFYSILDGGAPCKHTDWTWGAATSDTVWTGYTWRDDTGSTPPSTTAGFKHETVLSPRTQITARKRAGLRVTMAGTLPGTGGADDPTARRVYMEQAASDPGAGGFAAQAITTSTSYLVEEFDSAGTADPTSGTFPGGTPSSITPQATDVAPLLASGDGFMPVGVVLPFAGSSTPPAGWLLCNGASVLRATYPELFAVIGTTYGSVDGTHFTLPDLRDKHPAGIGTSVAAAGGGGGTHASGGSHQHEAHGQASNTTAGAAATRLTGNGLPDGTRHGADGGHTHEAHDYASGKVAPYVGLHFIIRT